MGPADAHADLRAIRLRLLDALLWGLAALAFPAYVLNFGSMLRIGFLTHLGVITAVYGALLVAAFVRRLGFALRSGVLLGALYLLALHALGRFGLAGAGLLLMVTVAVLTTVLFGLRAGLPAAAAVIASSGVVAFAQVRGWIALDPQVAETFDEAGPWTAGIAVLAMVVSVLVAGPGLLQRHLLRALERLERARGELSREVEAHARLATQAAALADQLQQAQKMEAVGQLAGGVAHDFNNVLTAVRGHAELGLLEVEPGSRAVEHLMGVLAAADRAAELTGRLLAFSRQKVVATGPVSLHASVRSLEPMLRRLIGDDIVLALDLGARREVVRGVRNQLDLALMNLVLNARDAMPGGGRLTIRSADAGGAPARVRVEVEDTGAGMDEATCRRAFEPFFTTKPPGRGTGLGLTMVYNIVRGLGGTIAVRSSLGLGTTFSLEFETIDAVPEALPEATAGAPPPRGVETVLLVEDDRMVRETTAAILSELGYTVIEACDGEQALERFAGVARVDVLLVDVVMPGLSGRELAERLVAVSPALRVVFTSGYTEDDVLRRGVAAADLHFLAKPFTPLQLGAALRAALDGEPG